MRVFGSGCNDADFNRPCNIRLFKRLATVFLEIGRMKASLKTHLPCNFIKTRPVMGVGRHGGKASPQPEARACLLLNLAYRRAIGVDGSNYIFPINTRWSAS